jgi:plastocyanin
MVQVMTNDDASGGHGAGGDGEVRQRLLLPLLVPIIIFLFAVLAIYGLSRIYLDLSTIEWGDVNAAVPLALGVALAILLVAVYLVSLPRVEPVLVAAIFVGAAGLLTGGTIWAALYDEGGGGPTSPSNYILMINGIKFDKDEMHIPPNVDVPIVADNQEQGVTHNWAAYTDESASELIAGSDQCPGPCTEVVTVNLDVGEYYFQCDVHPTLMTGTLFVEEGAPTPEPPPGEAGAPTGGGAAAQ